MCFAHLIKTAGKEDENMRQLRKMKRIFTSLGLCVALAAALVGTVNAQEADVGGAETEVQVLAEYDLEKGGTQSFAFVDENGEETEIVVEEVPGTDRVANGTYKITGKMKYLWKAGFCVNISANRLTKVYGAFYNATRGSIRNAKLVKNSDAQATLSFAYLHDNISGKAGVKAKIFN